MRSLYLFLAVVADHGHSYQMLAILWWFCWQYYTTSTPEQHCGISPEELFLIRGRNTVNQTQRDHPEVCGRGEQSLESVEALPSVLDLPWRAIARSLPAWALFVNHFGCNWALYTLLTWLPDFLKNELNFDLKHAGFIASLPYLAEFFVAVIAGVAADHLIACGLSILHTRKLMQCLGTILPGLFLVLAGYTDSVVVAVFYLVLATGLAGCMAGGFTPNYLDICPKFAGPLYGVSNTLATIPGIISPALTGWILGADPSIEAWRNVFYIAFAMYGFAALFFISFAQANEIPALNQVRGSVLQQK